MVQRTLPPNQSSPFPAPDSPDTGFTQRIQLLIQHVGSITRIAKYCGFSEGVVRSWRDGRSDPSRRRCLALARGLGISLVWLMSGEGAMLPDDTPPTATGEVLERVDPERLTRSIRLVHSTLGNAAGRLTLESRVDAVARIYATLGEADPAARADGISHIHHELAEYLRKLDTTG